jgi:3'-phosphoadenosine 5'-phosphosulfate sulfotransferase (PAPS reductase)/FAD synthetase
MKDKLLVCTFSGGRTSAFMGLMLKDLPKYKEFKKLFIFANTGKEKEETLEFIDRCDKEWNLNVVWLEAKIITEKGIGTTYKIVDFKTASRNGEPFEDMLNKYPMPTVFASNCTRELKLAPMNKYIKTLGFNQVITALGIRYDERHRKSNTAEEQNIVYPLCDDLKVDSKFIRDWWSRQCFDLKLKDYEGNCDLCFKKSVRKRLTLIKEDPNIANWWLEVENKYSTDKVPRFDLRTNISMEELIEKAQHPFRTIQDQYELGKTQAALFDEDLDIETDCFCKAT